jgi:hypothetical protein
MLGNLAAWVTGALDNVFEYPQDDSEFENGLIDLQCGRTVFNDVPSKMRTELWASQLHRQNAASAAVAKYSSLASSSLPPDVVAEIEKDTHRTFPGHRWLSGRAGQLAMLRVLRAYAVFDPEVGYTQGMNFLAGLFLAYLDEAQAFGALVLVMQDRGLRALYLPNDGMALLQVRLWQLGRLMPPRLSTHLENHAALPVLYASSWFLTCYSADFSMHLAARVMDLVVTDHYAAPFMKVAVHILERCEEELLAMEDLEEIVDFLRKDVPKWPRGKLQDLLTEALGKGWTARQTEVLKEINGAESVAEAVARVDLALATGGGPGVGAEEGEAATSKTSPTTSPTSSLPANTNSSSTTTTSATTPVKLPLPPLPPPPTSRKDKVEWSKWRPTDPSLLQTENIKIQTELSEVALDPQLSRELSTYLGKNESTVAVCEIPSRVEENEEEEEDPSSSVGVGVDKVTTEMSVHLNSPSSPQVEKPSAPISTGSAERKPSPALPSPFESRSVASSSMGTHGTHSTLENSLSVNAGEFSDFTGALDRAASTGGGGGGKQSSSGAGGGAGVQEPTTSWGQSAADSITYLLGNLSMGQHNASDIHAMQPKESVSESPGLSGMLPSVAMSGFGSWRVADPAPSGQVIDPIKEESASGDGKDKEAASAEKAKSPTMASLSSSSVAMSPANSRVELLQQAHLNEFSASAKAPPKNRWT